MKLYTYFRSSAAYRVRIALQVKHIAYQPIFINLAQNEQNDRDFLEKNPQGLVPVLVDGNHRLTQSLAIMEYLEEQNHPPTLLPGDAATRAYIRALSLSIIADIHPINNLRVLEFLSGPMEKNETEKITWYHHWLEKGFSAIEENLARRKANNFCFENQITLADVCLIPQVYNAIRFNFPMEKYPRISAINAHCLSLPAFQAATPDHQADNPATQNTGDQHG